MDMKTSPTSRCPHCESQSTAKLGQKRVILGVILGLLGIILAPILIGLVLIPIGIVLFAAGVFTRNDLFVCKTCNREFKVGFLEG